MSSPADAVRRPGQWMRPRHAGPPGRPAVYVPSSEPSPGSTGRIEATNGVEPLSDQAEQGGSPSAAERSEPIDPAEPPTEPIRAGTLSSEWWPEPSLGPMSSVPGWLIAAAVIVLLGVVGVLGFVRPGFFVTPVLDQASVQDGVGMILRDTYRLPDVVDVTCPADQQVLPGRSFTCVAVVDGKRSEIPVVIQDKAGRYQVGRPMP